jgi:hypothetical protein
LFVSKFPVIFATSIDTFGNHYIRWLRAISILPRFSLITPRHTLRITHLRQVCYANKYILQTVP